MWEVRRAGGIDFTHVLASKLALFIAIVVLLAAVLLLVVFRSLVIPVQAAVMNLLSIGAALGVTVLIFQHGWLGDLFGVQPGPIEPWLPVMLFAIVFGLSMDYEVFLVSRIHEEWNRRRDASQAVVEGVASTGRVITAAATIMICVFLSFVFGDNRDIKLFGLSLASAVFLDAFVIRCLLLPAVLELLGRTTWLLPALAGPSAAAGGGRGAGAGSRHARAGRGLIVWPCGLARDFWTNFRGVEKCNALSNNPRPCRWQWRAGMGRSRCDLRGCCLPATSGSSA